MALTSAYLITPKNLESFLAAVQTAQAPERMNSKFLTDLDFTSSNDRLFIGVFKALGFINDAGEPTDRYFEFLDQSQGGRILAAGIRDAYEDLFRVNKDANRLDEADVKNKLRTLTRGEKSDNVLGLMAKTFVSLCALADWTKSETKPDDGPVLEDVPETPRPLSVPGRGNARLEAGGLHYNIQIHLPASRDSTVYDAIFKSLKDHLLA